MTFSESGYVGATTLPLTAGSTNAKLTDPIVEALLDFLAWYLNNDLNAKLATLKGTSAQAVPTANKFSFDPFEPRGHSVKRPVPALYIWWDGNEEQWQVSHLCKGRIRNISLLYICDELPSLEAMNIRSGLLSAVAAVLTKAADRGYHPSYSYNSKPNGTPLELSIGDLNWDWSWLGSREIQRIGIDEQTILSSIRRNSGRHYPALAARIQVRELIQRPQPNDPDDLARDSQFVMSHDGQEVLDRTLGAPDGSQ